MAHLSQSKLGTNRQTIQVLRQLTRNSWKEQMKHHSCEGRCTGKNRLQTTFVLSSAGARSKGSGGQFGTAFKPNHADSPMPFTPRYIQVRLVSSRTYQLVQKCLLTTAQPKGWQHQNEKNGNFLSAGGRWIATICLAITLGLPHVCATEQSQQPKSNSGNVTKDFAGRRLPAIAKELVNFAKPARTIWLVTEPFPGWTYKDGSTEAGSDFEGDPFHALQDAGLALENLYKKGYRVGVVRKTFPDKSWQVMDVFARTDKEIATELCDRAGHDVPENHLLIGIMHANDPNFPPTPPRPTPNEAAAYRKNHPGGVNPPRYCIGNNQKARTAAILNLQTGKLKPYTVKPLVCLSPFFSPCDSN